MERKKFDKELFKNDTISREIVKKWFLRQGMEAFDGKDKYGIDLYVPKLKTPYVELERRLKWGDTSKFPIFQGWPETVHIPERKIRLIEKYQQDFWYIIVNEPGTYLGILSPSLVKKYMTKEYLVNCKNKFIRSGNEGFYDVPLNEFTYLPVN